MILNLLAKKFTFDGVNFYDNSIKFTLFGHEFEIMFYAIAILSGMILCVLCAIPMMKKQGLDPDILLDLMIAIIPCALLGARLWYVLNALEEFDSLAEVFNFSNGGLAIYGGIAGGALGIFIVTKLKKIKWTLIADIGCVLLPLGQVVGRWGNFFNQEVYGAPTTATFPFGVYIASEGEWRVALFFIEGLLNLIVFITLYVLYFKTKPKANGYFVSAYFICYGLIRFILEPFRDPKFNLMVLGMKSQVLTSVLVILAGVAILVVRLIIDKPKWLVSLVAKIKKLFNKNTQSTNENQVDDSIEDTPVSSTDTNENPKIDSLADASETVALESEKK